MTNSVSHLRRWMFQLVTVLLLVVSAANIYAADNAYVETDSNVSINIDLAGLIVETYNSISVPATSNAGGSISAVSTTVFRYTPPATYSGVDTFNYTLLDAGNNPITSATITIQVGAAQNASVVTGSPSEAINDNIIATCNVNGSSGQIISSSLAELCANFASATPAEKIRIAEELAPKELGGQTQLSSNTASQQIDGIRKRLARVRQGMTGFDVARLHIRDSDTDMALGQLPEIVTGGAASADSGQRLGGFVSGKIGSISHDASDEEDGYSIKNRGLTFGGDYRFSDRTVAGVAVARNNDSMEIENDGGNLDSSSFSLIGYTSYYIDKNSYVEAIWTLSNGNFDANRHIQFSASGNNIDKNATSNIGNQVLTTSVGFGYEIFQQRRYTLTMSANVDRINSAIDGYAEEGAAGYNLVISKREKTQITSSVDATLIYTVSLVGSVLIPQASLTWKHAISDDLETISGYFKEDPDKNRFSFSTETPDKDFFKLNLGISNVLPGGNTGFLNYEQVLAKSGYSEYNIALGMRFVF